MRTIRGLATNFDKSIVITVFICKKKKKTTQKNLFSFPPGEILTMTHDKGTGTL